MVDAVLIPRSTIERQSDHEMYGLKFHPQGGGGAIRVTKSRSKSIFEPSSEDDPKQRQPDIRFAKEV
jgi:hypothetical protein